MKRKAIDEIFNEQLMGEIALVLLSFTFLYFSILVVFRHDISYGLLLFSFKLVLLLYTIICAVGSVSWFKHCKKHPYVEGEEVKPIECGIVKKESKLPLTFDYISEPSVEEAYEPIEDIVPNSNYRVLDNESEEFRSSEEVERFEDINHKHNMLADLLIDKDIEDATEWN